MAKNKIKKINRQTMVDIIYNITTQETKAGATRTNPS